MRLWFCVEGDKRFLSHHDMMRLWERALRRAGLPLRLSQGYNPRPKMSLTEPRSVGIASEAEILEFELADWVNPDAVLERLRSQVPSGIAMRSLDLVRPTDKAHPTTVVYVARLESPPSDLADRARRVLDRREAPVVRPRPKGDKHLDARPFIQDLETTDGREVRMTLATGPSGTVRPDEVLRLMGFDRDEILRADIQRTDIRLG
ncbi:MAG: TIGR03936 family radical SAM-associated protein [Planctomycetota bacterium]|nr:TIGR03936 family radical SAM-associated protein [Planctomycetota bacterium]